MSDYELAAKNAKAASAKAAKVNTALAHRNAAAMQRIAAEHAKLDPELEHKANKHFDLEAKHRTAAEALQALSATESGDGGVKEAAGQGRDFNPGAVKEGDDLEIGSHTEPGAPTKGSDADAKSKEELEKQRAATEKEEGGEPKFVELGEGEETVECPHCGKDFEVDKELADKTEPTRCPHCKESFELKMKCKAGTDDEAALVATNPLLAELLSRLSVAQDTAMEASNEPGHPFYGNQYAAQASVARKAGVKAEGAEAKTRHNFTPGSPGDSQAHHLAAQAHDNAAGEHFKAAKLAEKAGETNLASMHRSVAKYHEEQANRHIGRIPNSYFKASNKNLLAKLNELSAARLAKNEALTASVAGVGMSLNDLREVVQKAINEIDFPDEDENEGQFPGSPYVADICAPDHEEGEVWEAVVSCPCGGLYCVKFKVPSGKEEVEIVGEPEEVERTTNYEYVTEMETEAKRAVEAANPEGINQYTKGGGSYKEADQHAEGKSDEAEKAHKDAYKEAANYEDAHNKGNKDSSVWRAVAEKHQQAADAHKAAMKIAPRDTKQYHKSKMLGHQGAAENALRVAKKVGAGKSAFDSSANTDDEGLEAGDFKGNQHQSSKEVAEEHSAAAKVASRGARKASREALNAEDDKREEFHQKATDAHKTAHAAHTAASAKQKSAGNEMEAEYHAGRATYHQGKSEEHAAKVSACNMKAAMAAEKEASLKAANPEGINQYTRYASVAGVAEQKTKEAEDARSEANRKGTDFSLHRTATKKSREASEAHSRAADEATTRSAKAYHTKQAEWHDNRADRHSALAEKYDTPEYNSRNAKEPKHAVLDCARAEANNLRSLLPLDPLTEGVLMYMPGGVHTITPSQRGKPVTVTVNVDAHSAELLETQRQELEAQGKKPFFSVMHDTEIAAFWPSRIFWDKKLDARGDLVEGVWAEGEWTKSGREAVEGKDFRTFSPTFFVDAVRNDLDNPCEVVNASDDARANMGALENDPAFQNISPLWARSAAGASETGGNNQTGETYMTEKEIAELQARKEQLEQKLAGLTDKTDPTSKAEARAYKAEIKEIEAKCTTNARDKRIAELEANEKQRIEVLATEEVGRLVELGVLPTMDKELQAEQRNAFIGNPKLIELSAKTHPRDGGARRLIERAVGGAAERMTPNAAGADRVLNAGIYGGFSVPGAMKKMAELVCANAAVSLYDPNTRNDDYKKKGRLAMEAAVLYKTELAPNIDKWQDLETFELGKAIGLQARNNRPVRAELQAADFSSDNSPSNVLGVLSGTLVLQRTLPFFAYKYPELLSLYTDFSDTPGLLNQTENTHLVLQPAVQKYDATTDGTGRPKGWSTVSSANVQDVPLTLTDYIAVPINFGQNILATTTRRLFDEQSVLSIKAIAGYFTNMLTNILTLANYNAYAVAGTNGVPAAGPVFPTYPRGVNELNMTDLDNVDSIFTKGKVPEEDRGVLLNPDYYAKLRADPRLFYMYMGSAGTAAAPTMGASQYLSEAKLPKLSGFAPYKAPYLPTSTPSTNPTTNNVVGWFFQKAAAILKSRLPQDFTQALGVMIPGSVTTVTDPDTKISLMLVQYVSLQGGWAEWRPEVILGVAKGDNRAGLIMTSQ